MESDDTDLRARRAFAVPRIQSGTKSDMVASMLDPSDRDDRAILIRLGHPEIDRALRAGQDEIEIDGHVVNGQLHLTMHEIIAEQLWHDDPPEVWDRRVTSLAAAPSSPPS
jgi:hypothetical protein